MNRRKLEGWWRKVAAQERPSPLVAVAQGILIGGTLPFQAVVRIRNFLYDVGLLPELKLPVPVVSFGNLTVGGTGKTPAVIWCARYLQARGVRPGVASRGYNPEAGGSGAPNDEAALIAEALPGVPHVWEEDRARAAGRLVREHGCNVIILDDGFQHRRLHRTLNVLLIDALVPFGFGHMLPRGLLREPISSLKRATHIVVTRSNLVSRDELVKIRQRIWQFDEGVKFADAVHRPVGFFTCDGARREPEEMRGKKVFAFCGIANPQSLLITLNNLGMQMVGMKAFADHHIYTDAELEEIFAQAADKGADLVVTTQKDRVKCGWRAGSKVPLAELRVEFEVVRGKEALESALDFLVSSMTEGRSS